MWLHMGDEAIDGGVAEYPSADKADSGSSEPLPACVGDKPVTEFAVAFYAPQSEVDEPFCFVHF